MCDVGGGRGHLLCHLLRRYPHLTGTVLERPRAIDPAQAHWPQTLQVADRCEFVAGDMFIDVPTADAYTMKMILHDWDDGECVQILRNLRRRAPPTGRVFIIEHVITDAGTSDYAALFDIHMMCWGTGRERTVLEYRELLEASGWTLTATWFPPGGEIGVIEGVVAR